MDSAAMRLSRQALMARPARELIRFKTTTRVISTRMNPAVKVEMGLIFTAPLAPSTSITTPSGSFLVRKDMYSRPSPVPMYSTFTRLRIISPKARVTIAK